MNRCFFKTCQDQTSQKTGGLPAQRGRGRGPVHSGGWDALHNFEWSRDYPIDVPATPTLPDANLRRYQEALDGANGLKEDAAAFFSFDRVMLSGTVRSTTRDTGATVSNSESNGHVTTRSMSPQHR